MTKVYQAIDPVTLAEHAALRFRRDHISGQAAPDSIVCQLDQAAGVLNLIDQDYSVHSERGFAIPVGGVVDEDLVSLSDFSRFNFQGTFIGYSKLLIDKMATVQEDDIYYADHTDLLERDGVLRVAALCVTFSGARLLPSKYKIPDQHMMVVPVLKVSKIKTASAQGS